MLIAQPVGFSGRMAKRKAFESITLKGMNVTGSRFLRAFDHFGDILDRTAFEMVENRQTSFIHPFVRSFTKCLFNNLLIIVGYWHRNHVLKVMVTLHYPI